MKTTTRHTPDARYQKTERTLWRNFCQLTKTHFFTITISELCRKSRVHPATFYRHARDLDDFLNQQKTIIQSDFADFVNSTTNQPPQIIFHRLLIFIHKRRIFFNYLITTHNVTIFADFIDQLQTPLTQGWTKYNPKLNHRIYRLYRAEIVTILTAWGEQKFPLTHISRLTKQLTTLTKTATTRLASSLKS